MQKEIVGGKLRLKKTLGVKKAIQKPKSSTMIPPRPELVPKVLGPPPATKEKPPAAPIASPPTNPPVTSQPQKTTAELRHEQALKARLPSRIQEKLKKSHRERIEEYNKKLAKLPEHFDIPRIGPG